MPIIALSVFPFISPIFSHFSLIWHRLGVSKGADRLTSPYRLKNIAEKANTSSTCQITISVSRNLPHLYIITPQAPNFKRTMYAQA
jgi:hypothetical protein